MQLEENLEGYHNYIQKIITVIYEIKVHASIIKSYSMLGK